MHIVIYETEHFETTYAMIRLFDLPAHQITVYTNEQTAARLFELLGTGKEKYRWIVQQTGETNRSFIRKMYAELNDDQPDMLLFGTVSHNYFLHALLLKKYPLKRSVLTIHGVNSMFQYPFGLGLRKMVTYFGT